MIKRADEINSHVRPFVDTIVAAIRSRIAEAVKAGLVDVKSITHGSKVEHPVQTYLDNKKGNSFVVMNVVFDPDPTWEVRVACGTFSPADKDNPEVLIGPNVQISSTLSTGGGSGVAFFIDPSSGDVRVTLSDFLYPGAKAMIEKYKGAELVSNIVIEMLNTARLQTVRAK